MDARRRQIKAAMILVFSCALTSSLGCNPLGWGVSQVQSLIHHHAHKPVIRDVEAPASLPRLDAPAPTDDRTASTIHFHAMEA